MRISVAAAWASLVIAALSMGASCQKKSRAKENGGGGPPSIGDADPTSGGAKSDGGAGMTAQPGDEVVPGVDIGKLSAAQKKLFMTLAESLSSPCGKAHSVLTSARTDAECKRSLWALRYLRRLIAADMTDEEARAIYETRYGVVKLKTIDLEGAPTVGDPSSPVKLVEYFDYNCGHCQEFAEVVEEVEKKYGMKISISFKFFPLSHFGDSSVDAAKAAIAAHKQGKFWAMHHLLFAAEGKLSPSAIAAMAEKAGLDARKFKDDMQAPATKAKIEKDRQEGIDIGVEATPTIYVNGREFSDPRTAPDLSDWVDEELAATGK